MTVRASVRSKRPWLAGAVVLACIAVIAIAWSRTRSRGVAAELDDAAVGDAVARPTPSDAVVDDATRDLAGVEDELRDAIRVAPTPQLYFELCVAQYQQGDYGKAQRSCKAALARSPDELLREQVQRTLDSIAAALGR